MNLRSFLSGCFFGCAHHVKERRGRDLYLVCEHCGDARKVLPKQRLRIRKPAKIVSFSDRRAKRA